MKYFTVLFGLAGFFAAGDASAVSVRVIAASPQGSRLHAELLASGIETCTGSCEQADAVIEVSPPRARVTFSDTTALNVSLTNGDDCVRLVELVRAKLLPLLTKSKAETNQTPDSVVKVSKKIDEEPLLYSRFDVAFGPEVHSEGGSVGADLSVRGRWFPRERFGVAVSVHMPLAGGTFAAVDGTASARAWLVGPELVLRPFVRSWMRASVGAGAFFVNLTVTGEGKAPYQTAALTQWLVVPYGTCEIAPRVTSQWSLPVSFIAGAAAPPTDIRFAGRVVDHWASPMLRGSVAIQYEF